MSKYVSLLVQLQISLNSNDEITPFRINDNQYIEIIIPATHTECTALLLIRLPTQPAIFNHYCEPFPNRTLYTFRYVSFAFFTFQTIQNYRDATFDGRGGGARIIRSEC